MAKDKIKLSDEEKDALKDICKDCDKEDHEIRKSMIRQWKKAEEFWHGVQYLFWSSTDNSWRSPADLAYDDNTLDNEIADEIGSFSDKVIDIYKAHGESIIAALSAQIPALRFLPDDADDSADTLTAKTYNKIADLVQRHNKAKLVFLRALFFLANNGVVASYRYKDSDFAYGSYKVPQMGSENREVPEGYVCKECDYTEAEDWTQKGLACPQCGNPNPPVAQMTTQSVPVVLGVDEKPKTRVKLDIFGGLHFKVSYYARTQSECTYFGLYISQGKDVAMETYPDLIDQIRAEQMENYDRFARSRYIYPTEEEVSKQHLVDIQKWWLRPAAFYRCEIAHLRDGLLKKFPQGCRVTLIGKMKHFADIIEEKLDDRWEIGQSGLSTYIYSDPVLRPIIEIQEMRNQLVNLIMETIEHGVPSEYATPDVVNFDTFNRFEAVPGYTYKTLPTKPGSRIADSFYTAPRAVLAKEVVVFLKQLDQDAQFAIGSFPSIYGGPSEGKSRTFSEYAASRQMALQRLSILWNLIVDWWVRTIAGSVKLYVESMVEDERFVKFQDGDYINIWIRKSEMEGKVGGVEPEGSEAFPISLAQKKDLLMKLMEMQNEYVNNALYSPDNVKVLQDSLALNELKIPGESQRVKQVLEINEMIRSKTGPVPAGTDETGQPSPGQSSVPIDPNVDDHAIHIHTLKSFMVDIQGLDLLKTNPQAYLDLTMHLQAHEMAMIQKTMQQNMTAPGVPAPTADAGVE